jgi:hypothetical protein
MRRRWDGDERGHGVASGESHVPHARRLIQALERPDWVAEDPQLHLLPHLERAALGLGFGLGGAAMDGATYELRLTWLGEKGRRPLRRAAHALIGAVAEESTHVAEWVDGDAVVFDVATGMVAEDAHFAPHGHLLRLRIQTGRAA